MMENYKICTVVVTFNRKELLINCLNAINNQTYKPHTVLIVDNASTDGTKELVVDNGFFDKNVNGINYQYLLLPNNQGGAGGFYNGIKTAHESEYKYDAVWVMDDDGIPDKDCLRHLAEYLPQYDYIAPLVLSVENNEKLAFNYQGDFSSELLRKEFKDVVPDYACPFNGILYSRKLIEKIGYPIPSLFIWGDEMNYSLRAIDAGFRPHTILSAIHFHPSDRMSTVNSLRGRAIIEVPNKWRGYCHWRNTIYNSRGRWNLYEYMRYYILNAYYYLFIKKSLGWFCVFNKAYFSGFKNTPDDGYRKYMK